MCVCVRTVKMIFNLELYLKFQSIFQHTRLFNLNFLLLYFHDLVYNYINIF